MLPLVFLATFEVTHQWFLVAFYEQGGHKKYKVYSPGLIEGSWLASQIVYTK